MLQSLSPEGSPVQTWEAPPNMYRETAPWYLYGSQSLLILDDYLFGLECLREELDGPLLVAHRTAASHAHLDVTGTSRAAD